MTKSVVFTPLSKEDISNIWDYTLQQWGVKQAVIYTKSLRDSCDALADPFAVRQSTDIREGYFKYRSGEHFIYYKDSDAEIIIIRILHKNMDVGRHL